MPAREGPEKLKILQKSQLRIWHWSMEADSWVSATQLRVEDVVGFFGTLQIEILNITRSAARWWGQIVWLAFVPKNWSQKLIKLFVPEKQSPPVYLHMCLYMYCITVEIKPIVIMQHFQKQRWKDINYLIWYKQLNALYSHEQLHIHICRCMQNHNDDTIKTSEDTSFRKIYLSLYLKGFERVTKSFIVWEVSWRLNRTATYWPPLL